ncbi:portal protein [Salinicola peritrichatus]|uniref:portal protein n=1 Tax=Salinicola peritrichatus TaxID=1267424 RepID=UPI000DA22C88|nr:hypothetical protein [Salinicola peritrichatus]
MAERQSLGLLQYRSSADMLADEQDAERQRQEEERRRRDIVEQSLSGHIRKSWENAKMAKNEVEQRMLDCLRRRKGEYDKTKLAQIRNEGGSEIYMMLTATKCRAASAWIRDILMPAHERPWGLEPTPVADIPAPYMQRLQMQVMQQIQQMVANGQQVDPQQQLAMLEDAKDQLRSHVQKIARKAADRHEDLIDDQLTEGGWLEALEGFVDDFTTYPGAILKGPMMRRVPTLAWGEGWQPIQTTEVRPEFERVSPFDLYPSPDSVNCDDGAYLIERIRYTRAHLNQLRGVRGYSDDALEKVLRDYGQGGLRDWLWTDGERQQLEGRGHEWLSNSETIDGLQYWGSAQGLSLLQWGMDPDAIDPLAEYEVEAILIGQHVIRCVINRDPLGSRPYHKASYQPVPGSFWGQAIAELMADIQDTCNATARSLINNLSISSGPQVDVNIDRIQAGEDISQFYPWKIWKTKSSLVNNDPAVRFFQPNSNAAELMGVYEKFETKADDATNIPRYTYGNEKVGGAGNTASGLSMLMESANKGIKDSVRHIDRGVIRRVIEALWLFNMQYSNDQSIKGDCKAVPRGSSAMLQREQVQMLRQQFLQMTGNPVDMGIIGTAGRAKLLRAIAEQLDMPDLVPDDRAVESQTAQQQKAQQMLNQLEQQIKQAEAQEKAARAQEAQADAQQTQIETQHDQAMLPLEQKKMLAEILKLLGDSRGDQHAGMEGVGAYPAEPGRGGFGGTRPALPRGGAGGVGNGPAAAFQPPAGSGVSGPGFG